MYWDIVLKEVLNKKPQENAFSLTNLAELQCKQNAKFKLKSDKLLNKPKKVLKSYFLGDKYKNVYFTKREAECMVLLLKGKTINKVASELILSPRTIEFYLKNMKNKLGCHTKFELIELVQGSDFMKNVDFVLK